VSDGRRGAIAALLAGVVVLVAVTGFAFWQGAQLVADRINSPAPVGKSAEVTASTKDRESAMDAATAMAKNLTTVDWRTVDADVQKIIDGSTGGFHDDFANRAQPFIDTVREAKSVSVGTVNASGVQSIGNGHAAVLLAVSVTTANDGVQAEPRAWRMKIALERRADRYVPSNVEFVP
jgi:Mce-associated membrane protein